MRKTLIQYQIQLGFTNFLGKYEEGLKYLERLEELGQDDAWTNGEFGYCLSRLERHEEGY